VSRPLAELQAAKERTVRMPGRMSESAFLGRPKMILRPSRLLGLSHVGGTRATASRLVPCLLS
jgi:hypothetical protein